MNVQSIRELVKRRPWRRLEILLDGGEQIIVRHPETILVGEFNIMIENADGTVEIFEPGAVSKIRQLKRGSKVGA
jgi:hypothetical protein